MDNTTLIETFLKSFNNREIATIIWLTVFMILVLVIKSVRDSFIHVLRLIVEKKMLLMQFLFYLYVTLEVSLLKIIGFWDYALLKDVFVWIVIVAIGLFMSMSSFESKGKRLDQFFGSVLWNNFRLILILEFVVNLYAFNIFLEIFLIGLISTFALLSAFAGTEEKHAQVKKFCDSIISIYGFSVLVYSIVIAVNNLETFATFDTLRSFLLPLLLTILYVPFLYIFSLVFIYEKLFLRLHFFFKDNSKLKSFTKWKIFCLCKLSTSSLQEFNERSMALLINAKNQQDVMRIISEFKENKKTEYDTDISLEE